MKQDFLKTILACLFIFVSIGKSSAHDIEVKNADGVTIYYKYNSKKTELAVTYQGKSYYDGSSYAGNVAIPESVTYNGNTYPVTSISNNAFTACSGLTEITIPNSVTSISFNAFSGCSGLTDIAIPNSVTSIGSDAFAYCSGLTEVTIPNSVTSISSSTFADCSSLTSITIPNGLKSIGDQAFSFCTSLKEITIPNSVTSIGKYAFAACKSLTEMPIGSGIASISEYIFVGCTGLTKITIPSSVTSIGEGAFSSCYGLTEATIGNGVTTIGNYAFSDCTSLTNVTIGNSVTNIGHFAFNRCASLVEITIPNSVTFIGEKAFKGCTGIKRLLIFADNITTICKDAFDGCHDALRAKRGTKCLLVLWNMGYTPYDVENDMMLTCPKLDISTGQTSITVKFEQLYNEYRYYIKAGIHSKETHGEEIVMSNLDPGTSYGQAYLYIAMGDLYDNPPPYFIAIEKDMKTKPLFSAINTTETASSIHATGTYIKGDAQVLSQSIGIYDYSLITQADSTLFATGLDPHQTYKIVYNIKAALSEGYSKTYSYEKTVRTSDLTLKTSQPKVVSVGNVIVAAETNLDDEETNAGFEWRRTDWTDDFASNTGTAYLYSGTMEGYIRNLNTEKLWKYRPYYLSNSGTYYYGDWVGLDPTNTSYFEPTVHTYATITIEGNTALVKGYALTGTDKVTVQGFKYWKSVAGIKTLGNISSPLAIPSDAMTVEANGQVMTASLTGLDFNTTYHYAAFVTTSEGETFYGEEQVFLTGDNPTGIEEIYSEIDGLEPLTVVARYNINGERITTPQKGVNILRMSDGSTQKVWVKKP